MPFTFAVDPAELIEERAPQWRFGGIEDAVLEEMSRRISDLWAEGPGGWAHEWSILAEQAEKDGDLLKASHLYGIAKFPVLGGNAAHTRAYENHMRTFLDASSGFEVPFERHVIDVDFRGETVQVPLHLYVPGNLPADAPIVLVFSGVDTWKVEVHATALATARLVGARVATVDMAGTGESPVANGPDGELYVGDVLGWLRRRFPEALKVGTVGFSFGGHWTIKLALRRMVDAAVSIGGLIDTAFTPEAVARLRFGMPGIFGNSLRLDAEPSLAELQAAMAAFSLRTQGLLDDWGSDPVPLLYANGDRDQHVPADDSRPLESRPNTVVRLVPNATHCAMQKAQEIVPWSLRWLRDQLA
ncbi:MULTISPECIES: alpha/beta fold hydrolase [unclassified Streptomyces]|uniref:alpha/beta fold hydrolase n=1 Tax=unclassified Streptomyces TaxID=2593676 RepID=UPI0014887DD5|nr:MULTISPECIES: alpha/beta fold hydrolase [unclassified Streptomyces]